MSTKKIIENILLSIVAIIAVFTILGDTATDVGTAADTITGANETLPLTTFFKRKGLILLIFMIAIVLLLMGLFMGGKK